MHLNVSLQSQGTSIVSGVFGSADASDARMQQLLLRAEVETDGSLQVCGL